MKIAMVSREYPDDRSHAGAFVHARAKAYRKYGHDVSVFVPLNRFILNRFEGVTVIRFHPGNIKAELIAGGFDRIFLHTPMVGSTLQSIPSDAEIVTFVHGAEVGVGADRLPFLWWRRQRAALRRHFSKGHPVVASSEFMASRVRETWGVSPVVIPNPVDMGLFYPNGTKRSPSGICVRGRARKYGTDMLTDLPIIVRIHHPESYYIPHRRMPALLNGYSFFVAPSRVEGQGVAMCEALSCGLPVVATNVGGIPEFVKDGVNGFLCDPTPSSIRSALSRYMEAVEDGAYPALSAAARSSAAGFDSMRVVTRDLEVTR